VLKLTAEFIPYILEYRTREIVELLKESGSVQQDLQMTLLHEIIEVVTSYTSPSTEVVLLATMSYRKLKSLLGNSDPYKNVKKKELSYVKHVFKSRVAGELDSLESSAEKVEYLLKLSALTSALNAIFEDSIELFEQVLAGLKKEKVHGASVEEFLESVKGKSMAFLPGSIGGFLIDIELLKLLSQDYGIDVDVYVKTGSYANDITYREATEEFEVPDRINVLPIETDAAGLDKLLVPKSDLDEILDHDVIVIKGLMNYCGLQGFKRESADYALLFLTHYYLAKRLGLPLRKIAIVRV